MQTIEKCSVYCSEAQARAFGVTKDEPVYVTVIVKRPFGLEPLLIQNARVRASFGGKHVAPGFVNVKIEHILPPVLAPNGKRCLHLSGMIAVECAPVGQAFAIAGAGAEVDMISIDNAALAFANAVEAKMAEIAAEPKPTYDDDTIDGDDDSDDDDSEE